MLLAAESAARRMIAASKLGSARDLVFSDRVRFSILVQMNRANEVGYLDIGVASVRED